MKYFIIVVLLFFSFSLNLNADGPIPCLDVTATLQEALLFVENIKQWENKIRLMNKLLELDMEKLKGYCDFVRGVRIEDHFFNEFNVYTNYEEFFNFKWYNRDAGGRDIWKQIYSGQPLESFFPVIDEYKIKNSWYIKNNNHILSILYRYEKMVSDYRKLQGSLIKKISNKSFSDIERLKSFEVKLKEFSAGAITGDGTWNESNQLNRLYFLWGQVKLEKILIRNEINALIRGNNQRLILRHSLWNACSKILMNFASMEIIDLEEEK